MKTFLFSALPNNSIISSLPCFFSCVNLRCFVKRKISSFKFNYNFFVSITVNLKLEFCEKVFWLMIVPNLCHIHTHKHKSIHIHKYSHIYTHTHTHIHTYSYTYTHVHTYTNTRTFTHIHKYSHIYTHTHTYTHKKHTHTHTYFNSDFQFIEEFEVSNSKSGLW